MGWFEDAAVRKCRWIWIKKRISRIKTLRTGTVVERSVDPCTDSDTIVCAGDAMPRMRCECSRTARRGFAVALSWRGTTFCRDVSNNTIIRRALCGMVHEQCVLSPAVRFLPHPAYERTVLQICFKPHPCYHRHFGVLPSDSSQEWHGLALSYETLPTIKCYAAMTSHCSERHSM